MGYTLFPAATSEPAKNGFFENISNGTLQAWTVDFKPGVYEVIPTSTTATYTLVLKTGGKNGTTVLTGSVANGGTTFTISETVNYIALTGTNAASALTNVAVRYLSNVQIYIPGSGFVTRYTTSTTSTLDGSAYILLVGGGSGGQAGNSAGQVYNSGGRAGAGGSSGRVLSVGPVTLVGGETVTIGAAGNANNTTLEGGNAGGNTSLGNYSSSNGTAASGGGAATNDNSPRTGGGGSASIKTNAPTIITNNFLTANSTTGGGGGGTWNWAVGESPGAGGGSGIGTGGNGGTNSTHAPSGSGFGAGGGGGAGRWENAPTQVPKGGNGTQGVVYVIMA
jgi:hypothetical protein